MKKTLFSVLAALLALPVLALAGMTAFDNMTELGDEMADIMGQVGIRIDTAVQVDGGYLAWTDSDGWGSGTWSNQGVLVLDGLRFDNGAETPGPMIMSNLTIDCGSDGAKTYLSIGLPSISGRINVNAICLGTNVADAQGNANLGGLTIGDLSVPSSSIKISAK